MRTRTKEIQYVLCDAKDMTNHRKNLEDNKSHVCDHEGCESNLVGDDNDDEDQCILVIIVAIMETLTLFCCPSSLINGWLFCLNRYEYTTTVHHDDGTQQYTMTTTVHDTTTVHFAECNNNNNKANFNRL
jgi:hypothetical protein